MHINTRRLIASAFILAFLIAAPILVLYTAGLRWNLKKWSLQKTGSIYIEVEPKDAEILINEKEIVYSSNDSPVAKSKEGSLVYAENIWKFEAGKINPKSDYVLNANVSNIPKEAAEIVKTDGASFAIFKDGQDGLIVGSITDNIFSKIDY